MIEEVAAETLRRRGTLGWLVGGTVRDRRSERFSPDLDIVVEDDPRDVAREISAALDSPWFALSARHGAFRVMAAEGHVDVAALQGGSIEEDLSRRDFTVNAMALPLCGGDLVDPFGGMGHLRAGLLVPVSERIFKEDPLRLMRAPRFCHVLGMRLDPSLDTLLRADAGLVVRAAGERVVSEMVLTLAAGRAAAAVGLWDDLGLLVALLPEIAPSSAEGESLEAGGRVGPECLEHLDRFLAQPDLVVGEGVVGELGAGSDSLEALVERLSLPVDGVVSRSVALRLAMILKGLDPEKADRVARRMKLSSAMVSLVRATATCFATGRCGEESLSAAAQPGRAMVSFLWSLEPWEPEVLLLAAACSAAARSMPRLPGAGAGSSDPEGDGFAAAGSLLAGWAARIRGGVSPPPVNGRDLMTKLGVLPGPELGRMLREVRLAWESGEASTAAELMQVARGMAGATAAEPDSA